ncbi:MULTISPECIES: DsbA family protein [unclassified Pusillimonas]|uniref:DsbA family protein n=1 Tax=unclassified Pusillimonas TaxID=2640016 RepID=UPI0013034984|nr:MULTISPECIES: DsbA family protein [unclassified Pusillimonas]
MKKVLHYIYDPLCGWCYAAEALVEAAASRAAGQFEIELHAGGLFARTHLPVATRDHIRIADARIGEMTGQVFGQAYLNGLLNDPETIYDSALPIRGVLAANAIKPGSSLPMLKALQRAHYRDGMRIVEIPTIARVAESIGLDTARFTAAFEETNKGALAKHLESTHRLMHDVGARGYPTFVAQVDQGFERLPHERFYGNAEGFAEMVSGVLGNGVSPQS